MKKREIPFRKITKTLISKTGNLMKLLKKKEAKQQGLKNKPADVSGLNFKHSPVRNLSLRTKLSLTFAVILLVPVLTISTLSYQTAKSEIGQQMANAAYENVRLLNATITQFTSAEMANVDYIASLITQETYTGAGATLQRNILEPFWRTHPMISSLEFVGTNSYYRNVQGKEWAGEGDPREQVWFKASMENTTPLVSQPYVSLITGDFVIGITKAVADGSGVIRSEVKIEELTGLTHSVNIGNEGYAMIFDSERKAVYHPSLAEGELAEESYIETLFSGDEGGFNYESEGTPKALAYVTNPLTGWKITGTMLTDEYAEEASPILNQTVVIVTAAILVAVLLIVYILYGLFKTLRTMIQTAETISQGDLSARIPVTGNDELGKLGRSFNSMADSIHGSMGRINETAIQLAASSQQLSASAEQATQATEHIADSAQGIHEGATKQEEMLSYNHEQIAVITGRMGEIEGYIQQLASLTEQARSRSNEGTGSVQEVVRQMDVINTFAEQQSSTITRLYEQSRQIEAIVKVIQEIAGQTNLLALNASIEAARAGAHGRGFAVVASEIRKLAEQTSNSTGSIKQLITEIQSGTAEAVSSMEQTVSEVGKGIRIVEETDRHFKGIEQAVAPIDDMSGTLGSITAEIAALAGVMAQSINNVIQIAGTNAGGTEAVSASVEEQIASMQEIAASAAYLSETAEELSSIVEKFKL
ncbi:methyl-accepting chemotaxis protein [Paenibacillus tarimensis]